MSKSCITIGVTESNPLPITRFGYAGKSQRKEEIINKDLHIGAVNRDLHKSAALWGGGVRGERKKRRKMDLNVV